MRYILQRSLNVPEVKLLSIMGTEQPAEFLTKIDIPVDPDNAGLSFALGSVEVSTVQMAAGFAMIQNKGIYISPTFYTKVVDAAGEEVIAATQKSERMMSEQNAYIETSLLKGPVKAGTASQFSNFLGSMGVAGKTGTTDNYIDRWFCGFTPYYAAACWYGNDANNAAFGNGVNGRGNPAANVWFNVMKLVSEDQEKKDFDRPDGIVSRTICRASGKIAKDGCTDTYSEIFNKDSLPGTCDGHTSVRICTETGKLATDFCPNVEEKSFAVIDTEKNAAWSPKLESTEAPTESCDVHTHAPEIDVPNVVGMKEAEAKAKLISAGFVVDASKKDDNVAYGIVAKQSALKAPAGATIVLTIGQKKNVGPVTPPGNEADENTIHANKIPDDPINPPIDDDD
jgi:penicillin-binding protein 1A